MDYSELVNAVTPAKRTDKFKTVAALYCLGADSNPAKAGDVGKLMRRHLRSKAPTNAHDILAKNGALISVVDGKPLKWKLLPKGIEYLTKETGLILERISASSSRGHLCDIAIICALEDPEFKYVLSSFGGDDKWREIVDNRFPHVYRETMLTTDSGETLRVIGVTATSMGLTAAAIVTTQVSLQFRPRIVAMIGISAGTQDGKKQFGDILVADPSIDYASGKIEFVAGRREFRPDPYPIGLHPRLRSLLKKFHRGHSIFSEIRSSWSGPKPTEPPCLYLGALGAADQVIDDESKIAEIKLSWRKLIGVEMETYGVYRACGEAPDPKPRCVAFKSVCDFAANKDDSWQEYAAFTAAEFAIKFFKSAWHLLWDNERENQ